MHNVFFCARTLCMSYITNMFLMVSSSVPRKQLLCFVCLQGQKSEQKRTTKNFVRFHNHSPLIAMVIPSKLIYVPKYFGCCTLILKALFKLTSGRSNDSFS